MVDFDDEHDKHHVITIKRRLARRGLEPDEDMDWEVHGPHPPNMNFQVYVGWAGPTESTEEVCVAIYPWATYKILGPRQWFKVGGENRIYIDR